MKRRKKKTLHKFVCFHNVPIKKNNNKAKDPIERKQGEKEVSVLDVGGKPKRLFPGKTHAVRAWT